MLKRTSVHPRFGEFHRCDPYRVRVGDEIDRYLGNAFILFDVDWPSDHMLQLFWHLATGVFELKHFELVG